MRLRGKVAVVTGASRGAGRGIAKVLGEEGGTVYVTGRTSRETGSPTGRPETIEHTAEQVNARGGDGIPVRCDHTDAAQVQSLFGRVQAAHGRLDILVSNAWGGYERDVDDAPVWELAPEHLDLMLAAGLRAHILSVQFAAPLLRATRGGLVVLTTWRINKPYHKHLYYDVVKTAINRMPVGLAEEFRPYDVTTLAVSPGALHDHEIDSTSSWAAFTESTEFVGRAVAALASDRAVSRHSGSVRTVVELANEYGFTDISGRPTSDFWEGKVFQGDGGVTDTER
ncbi:MAG: SDR family NAD(P)-dependent oxidoreductase [Actinopolymorphaceae bacterium]